jgi:CheY-like chemotaxis protein
MPILVVEGNDHVRDVISAILEIEGHDVLIASNGIEALHLLRRRDDIALALVDVTVPSLDGWHLRRTMLSSPALSAVPLVMMTGGIPPDDVPPGVLLRKPFGMADLLETVRTRALRRRRRKPARAGVSHVRYPNLSRMK